MPRLFTFLPVAIGPRTLPGAMGPGIFLHRSRSSENISRVGFGHVADRRCVGRRCLKVQEATEERVRRWLIQAEGYLELEMYHQACERLEAADRTGFLPFERAVLWGEYYRSRGRHETAIEKFEAARQLRPDNVQVAIGLGWSYKRLGRLDKAIEALERCLAANPEEAILHYNLACYYSLARNRERMLEHFRRAISLHAPFRKAAVTESDFDPFRDDPAFQALIRDDASRSE